MSTPVISPEILAPVQNLGGSATSAQARAAALIAAALPMDPTPINRYWRIDFGRIDLKLEAPRPLTRPVFELDARTAARGVVLCSLDHAVERYPDIVQSIFGTLIAPEESRFTALAAALEFGGYFLHVPPGVVIAEPVSIRIDVADGALYCPRNVISLGDGAQITIHESVIKHAESNVATTQTLVCGTTEASVGIGADLRVYSRQDVDTSARVFMTRRARIAVQARMTWTHAELGGEIVRSILDASLEGKNAHADLAAVYFPFQRQHVDVSTEIRHAVPRTTSRTTVKAAAQEFGQGRYTGNIRILPGAHGSEAALRDDSLLLSPGAHIDAVPALEIAANDVQAFHGATVGAIDNEVRFYLMSRGIPALEAERMVTLAFFEPVMETINDAESRDALRALLTLRIDAAHAR